MTIDLRLSPDNYREAIWTTIELLIMNWTKIIERHSLKIILLIQVILIAWTFSHLFTNDFILANSIDGLKNYFTYLTYLEEEGAVWLQNSMNYPFGEYIFYTDNTTIFSMVVKFINTHLFDVYPYRFIIFNSFFLGGLLLSTWFCWRILKELQIHFLLAIIASICLPWICPQILKNTVGHFNLSLSWLFLLTFYGLIRLYQTLPQHNQKTYWIAFGLTLLTFFSGLIHLYYLPIIGIMIGTFGLLWSIQERKQKTFALKILGIHTLIPALALILTLGLIKSVDTYYALRSSDVDFNYIHFNFKIDALYSAYPFTSIPFPISTHLTLYSYGYLGGFVLFGSMVLLIWWTIRRFNTQIWAAYFHTQNGRLVLLLFGTGLMVLIISIGNYAKMFNNTLSFDNVFSPFYYLAAIFDQSKQFRVIARFSYPFFWVANFVIIFLISNLLRRQKTKNWTIYLAIVLSGFMVLEMTDFIRHFKKIKITNTLHSTHFDKDIQTLSQQINQNDFDAILPIPFYIHGSEQMDYTFMPTPQWLNQTYQLSLSTKLPLVSSHLTRTALTQHLQILSLFEQQTNTDFLNQLKGQKILVVYSEAEKDWTAIPQNENAKRLWSNGRNFPNQYNLKEISQSNELLLYEWQIE